MLHTWLIWNSSNHGKGDLGGAGGGNEAYYQSDQQYYENNYFLPFFTILLQRFND